MRDREREREKARERESGLEHNVASNHVKVSAVQLDGCTTNV